MDAQVVLITGASRGFGAAAARSIAGRGHTVVATMRDPARDAAAVTAGLRGPHPPGPPRRHRAGRGRGSVVAATLATHGRIDVLINNAGYGLYGPAELGTEEQLWRQLDTNTFGAWRMIKAVLPDMRRRGRGKIVNVTSLSGRIVAPMLAHYAATKFALEALGEGLRFEVGALGVQVCTRRARHVRQRLADLQPRRHRRRRRRAVRGAGRRAARRLPAPRRHPSRLGQRRRRPRRHRRPRPTAADALAGRLRGHPRHRHPRQPLRRGVGLAAAQRRPRPVAPPAAHGPAARRPSTTGRPGTSCSSPAPRVASAPRPLASWPGAATPSSPRCAARSATRRRSSPASRTASTRCASTSPSRPR